MKPRMQPLTEKEIQKVRDDLHGRVLEIAKRFAPLFEKNGYTWCMYDGESRVPTWEEIATIISRLIMELYHGEPSVHVSTGRITIEIGKYVYRPLGFDAENKVSISTCVYLNADTIIITS